jgi:hypothetical protein
MALTPNRFDNVAAAAGSGVDIETIIETLSDSKAEFGELEGDEPRPSGRAEGEVGTPTLEETLDFYDQGRPADIQITPKNQS